MNLKYIFNDENISKQEFDELRQLVEWNSMNDYFEKYICNSYLYISCYDNTKLIGFLDVISNSCSDAYIQDVVVHPSYQGQGIGTTLMQMAIDELKKNNIYAICVFFEPKLFEFYKRFGFYKMEAGIITTDMNK